MLIILFSLMAAGCGTSGPTEEEKTEIQHLLEWNLYFAHTRDLNGYMGTLHPDSPLYSQTAATMRDLFTVDATIQYELVSFDIISFEAASAEVRVVQITRKVGGTALFRDNRIVVVHTLRRGEDGTWRIYDSEVEEVEYLSYEPAPTGPMLSLRRFTPPRLERA